MPRHLSARGCPSTECCSPLRRLRCLASYRGWGLRCSLDRKLLKTMKQSRAGSTRTSRMSGSDPLELFLPPVREWFRAALGEPSPARRQGWPAIAAGQNTLILAPTGSGKTLAAFLACLDGLWRQDPIPAGVRVLYISPLKALNNDIHRNLQVPLEGVA